LIIGGIKAGFGRRRRDFAEGLPAFTGLLGTVSFSTFGQRLFFLIFRHFLDAGGSTEGRQYHPTPPDATRANLARLAYLVAFAAAFRSGRLGPFFRRPLIVAGALLFIVIGRPTIQGNAPLGSIRV